MEQPELETADGLDEDTTSALFWHGDSDSEYEYEYDANETETIYVTLDLSTYNPRSARRRQRQLARSKEIKAQSTPYKRSANSEIVSEHEARPETPNGAEFTVNGVAEDGEQEPAPSTPAAKSTKEDSEEETLIITNLNTPHPAILHRKQLYTTHWATPLGTDIYIEPVPVNPQAQDQSSSQSLSQNERLSHKPTSTQYQISPSAPAPTLLTSHSRLVATPVRPIPKPGTPADKIRKRKNKRRAQAAAATKRKMQEKEMKKKAKNKPPPMWMFMRDLRGEVKARNGENIQDGDAQNGESPDGNGPADDGTRHKSDLERAYVAPPRARHPDLDGEERRSARKRKPAVAWDDVEYERQERLGEGKKRRRRRKRTDAVLEERMTGGLWSLTGGGVWEVDAGENEDGNADAAQNDGAMNGCTDERHGHLTAPESTPGRVPGLTPDPNAPWEPVMSGALNPPSLAPAPTPPREPTQETHADGQTTEEPL